VACYASLELMSLATQHTQLDVRQLPGDIAPGAMLGPYRIVSHLARGGMANVWVARHHGARGFSKLVAVKTLLPEFAEDIGFQRLFFEEARLAALIRHPHVCEIFELVELNGLLSLSMEWVDGESLSSMLTRARKSLDRRIAARIISQAATGLHAAHELCDDGGRELSLVHRDVSPQNILVSNDGHVKLSDFGIAKVLYSQREATAVGIVRGKLPYMSPEQVRNRPLDRRSDIFSLGSVLFLATLGVRPFFLPHQTREEGLARLLRAEHPHPRELDPHFPSRLAAIIERALQPDVDKRYATAAEFGRDLEEWVISSGSIITETDVGRVVNECCGEVIQRRRAALRAAEDGGRASVTAAVGAHSATLSTEAPTLEGTAPTASTGITVPSRRPRRHANARSHKFAYSLMIAASVVGIAWGLSGTPSAIPGTRTNLAAQPVFTPLPRDISEAEPLDVVNVSALPVVTAQSPARMMSRARAPQLSSNAGLSAAKQIPPQSVPTPPRPVPTSSVRPPAVPMPKTAAQPRATTKPDQVGPLVRDL
jgi:eukaryotic-like serine/threonine-protein kinase